jgi:O-antigen/teichoic acid export membrane protein
MTNIILAAAQMALASLSWPYLAVLAGRARYDLLAGVETTMAAAGTLALFVAAIGSGTVQAFLWSQVLVSILAVLVARRVAGKFIQSDGRSAHPVSTFLRTAAPFGLTAFVQSAYTRCDLLLLGQFVPSSVLGLYSAAYKPITMLTHFGSSAAGTLFPYMVDELRAGTSGTFHRVMRVFAVTAPAVALIFSGLAVWMLETLYGEAFKDAAPMLAILAWSAAANWLYVPLCTTLQAKYKEYAWLRGLSIALIVNLIVNVAVIPRWGGTGAAFATLVSEIFLLGIGAWLVMKELGHRPPSRMVVCIAIAAGLGAWTLWQASHWGPIPATACALTMYTAMLRATGTIGWQDGLAILSRIREAGQGRHRS